MVVFDKKRWFGKQIKPIQVLLLTAILFIAIVLANLVADYLFDGTLVINKPNKEIARFLVPKFLFAVMMSFFIVFSPRYVRIKK